MTPYLAALVVVAVAAFVARIELIARLGTTMTVRRLLTRYLVAHVALVAAGVPLAVAHVRANGHPWWRAAAAAVAVYVLAGVLAAADYARLCSATDGRAVRDRRDVTTSRGQRSSRRLRLALLVAIPVPLMLMVLRRLPAGGPRWVVRP